MIGAGLTYAAVEPIPFMIMWKRSGTINRNDAGHTIGLRANSSQVSAGHRAESRVRFSQSLQSINQHTAAPTALCPSNSWCQSALGLRNQPYHVPLSTSVDTISDMI